VIYDEPTGWRIAVRQTTLGFVARLLDVDNEKLLWESLPHPTEEAARASAASYADLIGPWSANKSSYAAEGRTYCDCCGNSDADMEINEDVCYACLHPEETAARRQEAIRDHLYVFGEGETDY
jgi:hypothetical protein